MLTREYELLFIIKPHLSKEEYKEMFERVQKYITDNKGEILLSSEPGLKELATPVNKITQGYFIQIQFAGNNKVLSEIKTYFSINENIIRNLIVRLDSIQDINRDKKENAPVKG
ncbi:MAG: 30S ribosomal protein S6 [bacterium]|nr:30S ribosomal protein S6 [bacterium]